MIACEAPQDGRVQVTYDKQTGKVSQLSVDSTKDGKPNIFSYHGRRQSFAE